MNDYTELLSALPLDDIARHLGTDPETARAAATAAIPALVGGMRANAADPAGKASLIGALSQHDPRLVEGGVSLADVDVQDGERVVRNVFGSASNDVATRLGASQGVGASLFQKLLPLLAPIVLSYLTNRVLGNAGAGRSAPASGQGGLGDLLGGILGGGQGGGLGDLLGSVLGGAQPETSTRTGAPSVDINDILNDMLGGATAPTSGTAPSQGGVDDLLGSVLGGLLGGGKR